MALIPGVAGGNILPCRFLKQSVAAPNTYLAAGAGDMPCGISGRGVHLPAVMGIDADGYNAVSGESIDDAVGPEELGELELGGTCTAGQYLMASTNGVGIIVATAGDHYGAVAQRAGVSGDKIPVRCVVGVAGASVASGIP